MIKKIPVLVTGVGGGGNGHELVKTLRLTERYRLIGVDMAETSFGLFDVDEAYTVPPASNPLYIDTLLDICKKRQVKILMNGSEPELNVISKNKECFLSAGVLPLINTANVIELGLDKWATITSLKKHGFCVPESLLVQTEAEIPKNFILPTVIKPVVGGGGSNNTFVVQDYDELEFACRYLIRQNKSVLLQEYVGTPNDEYTVGILHTLNGELIDSISLRRHILSGLSNRIKVKNRTERTELSPILAISSGISQGVIENFPEIRQGCEAIATAIGSKGPLNVQCRFVDGKLYPFEINPRFSGTSYIRALAGFNEPDILIRHHLLGETLPHKSVNYKFGYGIRGLTERYITELQPVQPWLKTPSF
ncbi:ATP-grasp domain-containing protein [Candidatus Parabeggiatoa sp. HSG14]|uniref:ATP-grasp domain-containing protein n=1 Tax=Candidatus Parabeggiatoa sp. HSG14 TaxID=3055593 RepID=UPI0025A8E5DE|nr:ATP-grasp domain-containing protein [Thiotrichales bacterium HSG14]